MSNTNIPNIPTPAPRFAALDTWLQKISAYELWHHEWLDTRGTVTMYSANGRVFIVQRFEHPNGFEIFTPAHPGNEIALTFYGAELALGIVKGERE